MLGFSALSENPISSVNKVLELSASMTGLAVSSSAAAGTLIGASTMSAISLQTSVGTRVQTDSSTLESTSLASAAGVFIRGTISDTDLTSSFTQSSVLFRIRNNNASTVSSNFTQSALGEFLFEDLSTQDSVEVFSDLTSSSGLNLNTETFTDLEVKTIEQKLQEVVAWTDLQT